MKIFIANYLLDEYSFGGMNVYKLQIIDDISLLCPYSFKVKKKRYFCMVFSYGGGNSYKTNYSMEIYINHPWNVKIANITVCSMIDDKSSIIKWSNISSICMCNDYLSVWRSNLPMTIFLNKDSREAFEKTKEKLVFNIKRDIAIMKRFGYTFESM